MKKYLVTAETTGGQLETVDGEWLDYEGECVIGSFYANTKEEAGQLGLQRLANESDDRLIGQNYCMNAYELPSEQFLYTYISETSQSWVSVITAVYDSYDTAITAMIEQEKKICEEYGIDHEQASNDKLHDDTHEWSYHSDEEEWTAHIWYNNMEDNHNIDIRPVVLNQSIDILND